MNQNNPETPYIVVLVSAGSIEEARTITKACIERKLAACAQMFPIQSRYEWQGEVMEEAEYLIFLKSHRDVYANLEACISELHSYDVPEIIAMPVSNGLPSYLQWVSDSTGQPR